MLGTGQAGSRDRLLGRPGSPTGPNPAPSCVARCLLAARSPLAAPRRICSLRREAGAIKPHFNFALAGDGEGNRAANQTASLHASRCRQRKMQQPGKPERAGSSLGGNPWSQGAGMSCSLQTTAVPQPPRRDRCWLPSLRTGR